MERKKIVELARKSADSHEQESSRDEWHSHYYGFIMGMQQGLKVKNVPKIIKAAYDFKGEQLPDADVPFHPDGDSWFGIEEFLKFLQKGNLTYKYIGLYNDVEDGWNALTVPMDSYKECKSYCEIIILEVLTDEDFKIALILDKIE